MNLDGWYSTRRDVHAGYSQNRRCERHMCACLAGATITTKWHAGYAHWCSSPCVTTSIECLLGRRYNAHRTAYHWLTMALALTCHYEQRGAISTGGTVPAECAPLVLAWCSPLGAMVVPRTLAVMDIMWPISQSHFHVSCLCSLK